MGQACPAPAWRFLEQQPEELSLCQSQQEQCRQSERQQRLSGRLVFPPSTLHGQNCLMGIKWAYYEESRPAPAMLCGVSEYQPRSSSLVGSNVRRVARLFNISSLSTGIGLMVLTTLSEKQAPEAAQALIGKTQN